MIIEAKIINEKKVATLHFAIYFKNIWVSSWILILINGADKNDAHMTMRTWLIYSQENITCLSNGHERNSCFSMNF